MRPANLIPPEERRSRSGSLQAAPVAYIIVAALLLAIGGLTLLMTTNNHIADQKAEIAEAQHRTEVAEKQASELATFTTFHATAAARTQTVTNLADSRFDWEKVMRQIALIQPSGVWIINLSGSVRNGVSVGGVGVAIRSEVAGPALSIQGCAVSQDAVANYVTELKEIEGVTRVGLQSSAVSEGKVGASGGGQCKGKGTTEYQIVAAFDAAPIPTAVIGSEAPVEVVEEPSSTEGESSESSEPSTEGG